MPTHSERGSTIDTDRLSQLGLRRRDATLFGLTAIAACNSAPARAQGADATRLLLDRAVTVFLASWASGDWEPFLALCDDSMTFQFPTGPERGRRSGPDGKAALRRWTEGNRRSNNRITSSTADLKLFAENWVVFCDRGSGTFAGQAYSGLHAILMHSSDGRRIDEFREYFGELPS